MEPEALPDMPAEAVAQFDQLHRGLNEWLDKNIEQHRKNSVNEAGRISSVIALIVSLQISGDAEKLAAIAVDRLARE